MASSLAQGPAALWSASGAGPLVAQVWAQLSPYPPFSWMQWLALSIMKMPKLYRYYLCWSLGNTLFKAIAPGLHAQVITGTWLGILQAVAPPMYNENVAARVKQLLIKQAALRGTFASPAPRLPPEALEAAATRVKEDPVLLSALGSPGALRIWHRLEKTRLDDPGLLASIPESSQERWLLEALRAGYLGEVDLATQQGDILNAAAAMRKSMKALAEAVDEARGDAGVGLLRAGPGGPLAAVESASAAAAQAAHALKEAREKCGVAPGAPTTGDAVAWREQVLKIQSEYASSPEVAGELRRLSDITEP